MLLLQPDLLVAQSAGAAVGNDFPNECPRYDIKQSDGGTPVLAFGGIWDPSLPLHSDPLWPGVVTLGGFLSMS